MHECNAMQILEIKKKNTKTKEQRTMVTKEKQWSTRTMKTRQIRDIEGVFGLNLLLLKIENWKLKTENSVAK